MNRKEIDQLLKTRIDQLRALSYSDLLGLLDKETMTQVDGPSGRHYFIEASVFWDDKKGHDLRVLVAIDDGGWGALSPITEDFIVAPDGTFVGE